MACLGGGLRSSTASSSSLFHERGRYKNPNKYLTNLTNNNSIPYKTCQYTAVAMKVKLTNASDILIENSFKIIHCPKNVIWFET